MSGTITNKMNTICLCHIVVGIDDELCDDYCRLVCSWKLNPLRSTCTECIFHHVIYNVTSELADRIACFCSTHFCILFT